MERELKTKRLLLRQWKQSDLKTFASINADPDVMEFYPDIQSEQQSNEMAKYFQNLIEINGWGFWAVERLSDQQFIGFVGLHEPIFDLPVTPCVEIGWRLAKNAWGKGFATEAAKACLEFAFNELNLQNVYSFTSVGNKASISVMQKIGMTNMNANFDHPIIPKGHKLSEHVIYKLNAP
ncbi:GNAT family N-acetyltransferase [Marinicellulosiphila megalodicopiae]|uniref:GNAT family N-acetyltransferase n=1 Tax=Marinicellulosiphila megalodicopiae TaxID=2724896 RepID=UPI003BAF4D11